MSDTDTDTTGRAVLGAAYRDGSDLGARQSLYRWQQPRYDLPALIDQHLPPDLGILLDVGCGNGRILAALRRAHPAATAVGIDISAGILREVPPPVAVGDAARLPVGNGSADVVLALHMLYHVEDPAAAVAETARVLRPGGTTVVSTNARNDKSELDTLWSTAAGDVLGVAVGPRRLSLSARFPLDDASAALATVYRRVEVVELPGVITVTDAEPVLAHLGSYRAWADQVGVPFTATLDRARVILDHTIAEEGSFRITCRAGLLICRDP